MRPAYRWRALLALGFLVGLAACSQPPPAFRGTALDKVGWGRDFALTAHDGERLDTAGLRGKLLVLFFGYSHCPDICAPTLAKLAQVRRELGTQAERVQVLFVTVDPQHDTPAQLKKFLAGFDPAFIGLTGSTDELGAIAADHMVYFKPHKNPAQIQHTGMLFVKDAQGRMRLLVRESAPIEDLVHDLNLLLAE
jgi:protein SCO1/2